MSRYQLIELYFSRASALQWYWTLYVVIIGGLLAFSSLRKQPDRITTILVSILFVCFAYKNLEAIGETITQRQVIIQAIERSTIPFGEAEPLPRSELLPTLDNSPFPGVRNFHIACDLLTLAALWAMELRRRKNAALKP